jgi:hypothetical protein
MVLYLLNLVLSAVVGSGLPSGGAEPDFGSAWDPDG